MAGPAALERLRFEPPVLLELLEQPPQPPELPRAVLVAEIVGPDIRAERLIRAAGGTALTNQIEAIPQSTGPRIQSLYEGINRAADGDELARSMVTANVRASNLERVYKAGNITEIDLETDENGAILQHGQTLEDGQKNTLQFAYDIPKMRPRVQAETRNAFSLNEMYKLGLLEDNIYLIVSRTADDMSQSELEEAQFFADTMPTVLQAVTVRSGRLTMESAFIAGVKNHGAERHDKEMVEELGKAIGVDYSGKSAAQVIGMPALVPKELLPNGLIDAVRICDDITGGFFGEDKPRQDYSEYQEFCRRREATFEPRVEKIVEQLIAEKDSITDPVKAIERLGKLSEEHMVEKAIEDRTIDPRVFGPAAPHIEQARWLVEQGDIIGANNHIARAKEVAVSSDCPTAKSNGNDISDSSKTESADGDSGSESCPEIKDGQETTCPYCKKRVRAIVKGREKIYCSNAKCEAAAPEIKKR